MRNDGRALDQLREVKIEKNYLKGPDGSVLIEYGETKVICTAIIEDKVPFFLKGSNSGWLTAEYSMLPGSTERRKIRDSTRGKIDGRTQEIQRLIGRSLRTSLDLKKLGEKTIWIDCDVIQADGGTRTAAITGSYIALELGVRKLIHDGVLKEDPIRARLAGVSVGLLDKEAYLDLSYEEDYRADVDLNLVMNSRGQVVEIQGSGEEAAFTREELDLMLDIGEKGIKELLEIQEKILKA